MKLTSERLWWLKQFYIGGWTVGRPTMVGIKKWDAHSKALVKMGLLEHDISYPSTYRITDAGRAALQEQKP